MLKRFRKKKTQKKIWIILAILIVPAFIFWGSGSIGRSKLTPSSVGIISGRKISFLEYREAQEAIKNQATIQFGDNFQEAEKHLDLDSLVWERLILLTEAKKRRISVTDKEIIELIKSYPFFQRKGKFDPQLYSQMLQYVFHTPARLFEEQTRQNIMLYKLNAQITDSISITDTEIKDTYRKFNEQISIYYIASKLLDFTKDITVTDVELKRYYTKNSFQFKKPLTFNLEYISLDSKEKNEQSIIDILKKIILRLNKKEDFHKIAKYFGLMVKETGLFAETGPIPGIGWSTQILGLISKTKVGQYLPTIRIDNFYYILRLKEKKEPYIPDFEQIRDEVKESFIKDGSFTLARQKIEDCLKKLKEDYRINPQTLDFSKTAKLFGLKSSQTDLFKYGSYIEGIGASDNFWMVANGLKENEFSEVINVPSGFYIVKLRAIVPIDEQKFAAEKNAFVQQMLFVKKQEYFKKFLEDLKRNKAQKF